MRCGMYLPTYLGTCLQTKPLFFPFLGFCPTSLWDSYWCLLVFQNTFLPSCRKTYIKFYTFPHCIIRQSDKRPIQRPWDICLYKSLFPLPGPHTYVFFPPYLIVYLYCLSIVISYCLCHPKTLSGTELMWSVLLSGHHTCALCFCLLSCFVIHHTYALSATYFSLPYLFVY